MLNKIKENKKSIKFVLLIALCVLVSFYIIYKLSNSLFMVITGAIILLIGSFIKDPEIKETKEELSNLEQLTIFSNEVLEPVIVKPKKRKKKVETVIDIENTNSYKFDEVDKKIKKSKKVKA